MANTHLLRKHLKDLEKRAATASDEEKAILRLQYKYTKRSIEIIESIPEKKTPDKDVEAIKQNLF